MLAKEARKKAEEIRMELTSAIDHTERLQRSAHESVSEGLINKLAMTVTLTVSSWGRRISARVKGTTGYLRVFQRSELVLHGLPRIQVVLFLAHCMQCLC